MLPAHLIAAVLVASDSPAATALQGVVQSTGLTLEMARQFEVEPYPFQLQTEDGAYLLSSEADLAPWWGACVEVTGREQPVWDARNRRPEFFGRRLLAVTAIAERPCAPLAPSSRADRLRAARCPLGVGMFTGTVARSPRPFVDISTDYALQLAAPVDAAFAESDDGRQVEQLALSHDESARRELEAALGDDASVTVEGCRFGGYNHGEYLHVLSLRREPKPKAGGSPP